METNNPNDKKPKRPRIGENRSAAPEESEGKNTFNRPDNADTPQALPYGQDRPFRQHNNYGNRQQGGYGMQRPYNNRQQGGYNNRPGGYNQQRPYGNNRPGGYNQQRPYGNRPQGGYPAPQQTEGAPTPEGAENTASQSPVRDGAAGYNGGYQQRPYNNYNQQRPYNNRQQGGYNQQRPYNNRPGQQRPLRQNQFGMPHGGKSFVPRPKPVEYEMPIPDPNEQIRLNKYMANAGICSRREADDFIQQGLVKVNGNVVTELGTKITHSDTVEYDEKIVTLERKCYILLNKPKDCVTTSDDPNGRLTVMDIVKGACNERIYPVGRLDRNTTGVLLLTNDGDLASKLTHPKYIKKKIYHVWTDKDIAEDDMQRIADGIELDDGPIHADAISYATETDRNQAGIEIHSGRNRIVRRIFESLGYHVTKLDRVYFAGLTKKNLPRGRWRYLTQEEVNFLKMGSFE